MSYRVTTQMAWWVVVREADEKLMASGTVKECLRWVATWGDVDLGR